VDFIVPIVGLDFHFPSGQVSVLSARATNRLLKSSPQIADLKGRGFQPRRKSHQLNRGFKPLRDTLEGQEDLFSNLLSLSDFEPIHLQSA
jgi:hypothetical protein